MSDAWGNAADFVQALVVVGSIVLAVWRYWNLKISRARIAVVQMLNLLDEFPVFVSDKNRFEYQEYLTRSEERQLQPDTESKTLAVVPAPSWDDMAQDVADFREMFRSNLRDLWLALDSSRLFFQHSDEATTKELNNSGNVLRALNELIHLLRDADENFDIAEGQKIQKAKVAVVLRLQMFAVSLGRVAAKQKVFKRESDGMEYTPVLTDYHDWDVEFSRCVKKALKESDKDIIGLAEIYHHYDGRKQPADFRIKEYVTYAWNNNQDYQWQGLDEAAKDGIVGQVFREQFMKYYLSGQHRYFTGWRKGRVYKILRPGVNPEKTEAEG